MGARPAGSGKIRFCKSCRRERPAMLESRSWVGSPPLCWMTLSRGQAGFRSCEDSQAWILNPQAKISQLNNCAVDKAPGHPERNTHISKVRESPYSHLQCRDAWRVRPNPTGSIVVADHYHRVRCDSHWLTLVREQDAAQSHASEKNRDDRQKHSAVVSRRRIRPSQLPVQKFPVVLVHGGSPLQETPMKTRTNGQRSGFAVWWREKLIHKS